ncbi:SREBP regulating gene protein [Dendroctonus ponderosae]
MWYAALFRFLRRRIILGLILTLSLCYCIFSYIGKSDFLDNDDEVPVRRTQPFIWRTLQEHNSTNDVAATCRNSVQGRVLMVDDRGFLCTRSELLSSGCCNSELQTVIQYTCETCNPKQCCGIYEYCVSCCLHPDKKELLEAILKKATEQNNILLASASDHFELCLAKCRTNSQSVVHENSYRDPSAKHCFGETVPIPNYVET